MPGKLTIDTPDDLKIVITRTFDAPRDLVFDCITTPDLVKRWMTGPPGWTMPVCEIDLRVGGKYRYVWRNAEGQDMGMGGIYREISRPERIVSNELFDEDWTGGETIATMTLTEHDGRTTVTTAVTYSSTAARDAALRSGMTEGMEMGYANLDALLETV
ncbi:MAG TPA: SRPBCC family protein [Caulobacter sp.]|nr:SRPBCC family protein [Caulobacter sp.]